VNEEVDRVRSGSPFEDRYGFCRALRRGRRVEVAGTAPIPRPGEPLAEDAYRQMLRCGEIVAEALTRLGARVDDVVRTRMFIVDPADADAVGRAHREIFGGAPPVATMVVARLIDPNWKVELEVEAQLGREDPR
jgi:enamine deaminase RidA (YjgF/YER057c/UK114 family)